MEVLQTFFFFRNRNQSLYFFSMNAKEFKRLCRNRSFYIAQMYVIEEDIKKLENDYCTPRKPRLEVIGAPAHDHKSHIVDYISHKMILEKEYEKLKGFVKTIDEIKDLPKPWDDIFWKTLVDGTPVRPLCAEYDISKDMYYRKLAKIMKAIF